jgi:hypothetical protein
MNKTVSVSLAKATVQEIQLELIRRAGISSFDGKAVVSSLKRNRDLWEAAMIDRICLQRGIQIPYNALNKLREIPYGIWNADTLYVLTPSIAKGKKLARVAKKDQRGGEQHLHVDQEQLAAAMGGPALGTAVFQVWWD